MLGARGKLDYTDAVIEARRRLEASPGSVAYRAVLADEVQDLGPPELRLLRALVPPGRDDLFLVGDAHQRIYGRRAVLGHCGIQTRGRASRRLRINYRTTGPIRDLAVALLHGLTIDDLDGDVDHLEGYRSLRGGPTPEVRCFATPDEEARFILDHLRAWLAAGVPASAICVCARTHTQLRTYQALLEREGIPAARIEKDADATLAADHIRLATLHRLKGLEFPCILMAGVSAATLPLPLAGAAADDAAAEDHLTGERCLAYVAATRARDELVVSGFGAPSPLFGG